MASSAVSTLPKSVLSVTSSSSRVASKSVSCRMRSTTSTKSARRNCSGETLTEMVMSGQALPSRQACRNTHSPSDMMRPECSAIGMGPAAERLDADHGLAAVVDDRLIGDPQLAPLDGGAQVVLHQLALQEIVVHRGVVDAGAVAAFVLGAIERHVGVTHDIRHRP